MKSLVARRYVSTLCVVALLAGCSGLQTPFGRPGAIPADGSTATQRSFLYAAHCCGVLNNGDVTVFAPGQTKVARYIVEGVSDPVAVTLDRTGSLHVLNQFNAVTEYDPGSSEPARRVSGLYEAVALALDSSNNLYVANCRACLPSDVRGRSGTVDSVTVYRAHRTTLMRTITQGIHAPKSLAFDAAGNLYVANGGSGKAHRPSVTVYAPGSTSVLRTIKHGITEPLLLAVDTAGDLFVANIYAANIIEYASGTSKVLRTISDGIAGPLALALDASGNLYVANWPDSPTGPRGWISVYAPGKSTAQYRIVKGIDAPFALALDDGGNLYVGNILGEGYTSVYAPGAKEPMRKIDSGRFGDPRSLAFGSQ